MGDVTRVSEFYGYIQRSHVDLRQSTHILLHQKFVQELIELVAYHHRACFVEPVANINNV